MKKMNRKFLMNTKMKLSLLNLNGILPALVEFFHSDEARFPRDPVQLNQNLKNEFATGKLKKHFYKHQILKIFPSNNETNSKSFDVTLITRLILVLGIAVDDAEKQLIERARKWRNWLIHATTIDDNVFTTQWDEGEKMLQEFKFQFQDSAILRDSRLSMDASKFHEAMRDYRGKEMLSCEK